MTLTAERAREALDYDPATGSFKWRVKMGARGCAGKQAGHINAEGYLHIQIDGQKYLGHRLAFLIVNGTWPRSVDHIDLNKANNSWSNLREASQSENMANQTVRSTNLLGVKGVSRRPNGKYSAQIHCRGVKRYLGVFNTIDEASAAYRAAAVALNGEFARTA